MALGLFNKNDDNKVVSASTPFDNVPSAEKPINQGYGGEFYDTESQGGGRKMSRIDKAITKPIVPQGSDDDDSSGMSVGKQMEMEAGNAIKYRTCSWPKV
ncbi:hypothetical protein MBLNU459_g6854t3 [Dothideomycetes sp. NU459]